MSEEYTVRVTAEAPVNKTEVQDRVARAIEAIFPESTVSSEPTYVVAEGESLDRFTDCLHEQQILDTARAHLRTHADNNVIRFRLKKQAAFVGVVNFAVGESSELGDIDVEIEIIEPELPGLLDVIAPETDDDGQPVS